MSKVPLSYLLEIVIGGIFMTGGNLAGYRNLCKFSLSVVFSLRVDVKTCLVREISNVR